MVIKRVNKNKNCWQTTCFADYCSSTLTRCCRCNLLCCDSLLSRLRGLEVNFLVHLESFASKIFFHWQTGEITNKFFPFVWETRMIQTRKRLLVVDVFLSRRLSKSLAFCEFASVNFNDAKQPPKVNFARIQFSSVYCYAIKIYKSRSSKCFKANGEEVQGTPPPRAYKELAPLVFDVSRIRPRLGGLPHLQTFTSQNSTPPIT